MIIQFLFALLLIVIAVEAVTEILVQSSLLDIIGLRGFLHRRVLADAAPARSDGLFRRLAHLLYRLAHALVTCGWCTSVWVSGLFSWFLPGDYFGLLPWDNIVVKWFLVQRLSNYLHDAYKLMANGRVHTVDLEHKVTVTVRREDDDALKT